MSPRAFFADMIAVLHVGFAEFVILGLAAMIAGTMFGWRWTRSRCLVIPHTLATGFTAARVWLGIACPMKLIEHGVRNDASADPVARICHRLVFEGSDPNQFRAGVVLVAIVSSIFLIRRLWMEPGQIEN